MKGFVTALLLIGLAVTFWKVTLVLAVIWLAVAAVPKAYRELENERAWKRHRASQLTARADQHLDWWYRSDPRSVYGE